MNVIIEKYIEFLDFVANFLGEKTEIVLHDFSKGFDNSVVFIRNNLSGRKVGSPATDFALDVYKSKIYKEKNYLLNYKTKNFEGKDLISSSYFIKDKDELIGMICFNTDKSNLLNLKKLLESGIEKIDDQLNIKDEEGNEEILENFYSTSENLIEATIKEVTQGQDLSKHNLTRKEKLLIVKKLYEKGFFHLKDSVSKLAEVFKMSEVSIYKYIQTVRADEEWEL